MDKKQNNNWCLNVNYGLLEYVLKFYDIFDYTT